MRVAKMLMAMLAAVMLYVAPVQAGERIDLNTASVSELVQIKGIGPKTAAAIVEYRTQHGRFSSVEELSHVKGIGKKKLERIREQVKVEEKEHEEKD